MNFVIERATIQQAKAKIAIVGPAGSGKTYTSLVTARELGQSILVIDTENGSSAKYANQFEFDILRLPNYSIKTYIEALDFAASKGFDVVIVDSLSHAWAGKGGALEQAELAKAKYAGNKFAGWADVTPLQNQLIDTILNYPSHIIATMRMKIEYALVDDGKGKSKPQKLGLGIVQRDSFEYEFDIIAQMDVEHNLSVTKTRCFTLDGFMANKPDGLLGQQVKAWLTEGAPIPVWPDGWYPTKVQFFQKAKDEFDWSAQVTADKLVTAGFASGYDPQNAADMWRAIDPTAEPKAENNEPGPTELEELYPDILGEEAKQPPLEGLNEEEGPDKYYGSSK